MPGYATAVSLDLIYLEVSSKLLTFLNKRRDEVVGKRVGESCRIKAHLNIFESLAKEPIGTERSWEYEATGTGCLMINSLRAENCIISQGVLITYIAPAPVKDKAELKTAILKVIDELKNPDIGEKTKAEITRQLEMEVILKSLVEKMEKIEKVLYLDPGSLLPTVQKLEYRQIQDEKLWKELEEKKQRVDTLLQGAKFITSMPGGLKTSIIGIFIIQVAIAALIQYLVNYTNLAEKTLPKMSHTEIHSLSKELRQDEAEVKKEKSKN